MERKTSEWSTEKKKPVIHYPMVCNRRYRKLLKMEMTEKEREGNTYWKNFEGKGKHWCKD